jgi:hypothetical protein
VIASRSHLPKIYIPPCDVALETDAKQLLQPKPKELLAAPAYLVEAIPVTRLKCVRDRLLFG